MTNLDPGSYLATFDLNATNNATDVCHWVVGSSLTFTFPVLLAVILRVCVRCQKHAFGWDDGFIVGAAVFLAVLFVYCVLSTHYGIGKHIWTIFDSSRSSNPLDFLDQFKNITFSLYGCYVGYTASITWVKLSLIACYMRLFPGMFRKRLWVIGIASVSMFISSIFVLVFMCTPSRSAWDWSVRRESCINIQAYFYAAGVINTVTDIVLWLIPLNTLWTLHNARSLRIQLSLLFGVGFFAVICGILRLCRLDGLQTNDITYTSSMPIAWSVIEASVAMICACVPALKPLFTLAWNRWHGSVESHELRTKQRWPEPRRELHLNDQERALELEDVNFSNLRYYAVYSRTTSLVGSVGVRAEEGTCI